MVTLSYRDGESEVSKEVTATPSPAIASLSFDDPNLASCLDEYTYASEVQNISCEGITDLGGIGRLRGLTGASLSDSGDLDLGPLAELPGITGLDLGENEITASARSLPCPH